MIYIPEFTKFLMYFENEVVQIDLDLSYLSFPETAKEHAEGIAEQGGLEPGFIKIKNFTASTLPDMPVNFDFMCCPRSISDLSSKIGLGFIGSRVRKIVQVAGFPVLIPSTVYKEWKSISVLYGGSNNAVSALKAGIRLARLTGMPLKMYTKYERKRTRTDYEQIIDAAGLTVDVEKYVNQWVFFEKGSFEENLYDIPHDSLIVVGAYGHSLVKDFLFGSMMETMQSTMPNNMLIVGPEYSARM
jgi:hypothetical protein